MRLIRLLGITALCVLAGSVWLPALFGRTETRPEEGRPVLRYEIWVELDDAAKLLRGREEISWLNKSQDNVPDILFHLYYNAFKNGLSTVMQELREESLQMVMGESSPREGEWGWIDVTDIRLSDGTDLKPSLRFVTRDEPVHPQDQTVVQVSFPQPVKPDEEVHLHIEFQSKIPRTVLRSGYYQDSYFIAQWFPKPGVYEEGKGWNCHEYHLNSEFFADFADFVVHITVPAQYVVGASGKQTSAVSDEQKKTKTYTFEQTDIHDFAWTADPDFIKVERDFIAAQEVSAQEYGEMASKLGLPVEQIELPDVKMILLIEPEHRGQIDRHFRALRMALKYYGLWYGPYPYETITMVDPPFRTASGGMEYPTLFTAGTSILKSKNVLSPEGVIVHEFGHGYWYGLAANNEFEEAWLDEGINTYSTGRVLDKAFGHGELMLVPDRINGIPIGWFVHHGEFADWESERVPALNIVSYDPIVTPSWKFYSRMSYGLNVYMRAAVCLNTLERLLGEGLMARVMRTFQTRYRFKHPHTQDFISVVNEISGRNLNWFFEELFFNTLNFDYGLADLKSYEMPSSWPGVFDVGGKKQELTEKTLAELKGKEKSDQKQKTFVTEVTARRYGEAKVGGETKIKLRVVFEDGSQQERFWDGRARWAKFIFERPVRARYAQVDPDGIWLIDSNLANNSLRREASRAGIFRFVTRLLFFLQNYLQVLAALS